MTADSGHDTSGGARIPVDSFANRLMLARSHAGHLSIREAADLCDLGRGAWTNWERGAKPVDIIPIATRIAERLKIDREWLLFGGPLTEPATPTLRRRIVRGSAQSDRAEAATRPSSSLTSSAIRVAMRRRRRAGSPFGGRSARPSAVRATSAVPAMARRPIPLRPVAVAR
ncbi:MAG TPA: helix-turn-helix transcriptional regulator [Pseudonocardiaceae bacterium]|nr:helix-turn-helix transcriptional regulator [Pseudonocardiaceae bacterium]